MFELAPSGAPDPGLMAELDAAHRQVGRAQARFLRALAALDARTEDWQTEGAMDAEHYLGLRYGISRYRAERYLAAAGALSELPHLAAALEERLLHLEAVLELARYATPEDEQELIAWASRVPVGEIRRRGELLHAAARAKEVQEDRALEWRFRGQVFELWGRLPSADGALVASAIEGDRAGGGARAPAAGRGAPLLGPPRRRAGPPLLGGAGAPHRPRPRVRADAHLRCRGRGSSNAPG